MKDLFLIFLLIFITFWAINLLAHKEIYYFDIITHMEITETKSDIDLMTSKETTYFRWFYEYEIKNNSMYITTYKVVNPLAKTLGPQLEININKGSNNFDKIYLNSEDGNKLIWQE